MVDSARRDVELRVRAVLEGGGTLREAREEVQRWTQEQRRLAEEQRRLNRELADTIRLRREEAQQTRAASDGVGGAGGGGGRQTLFGLRPYELQNLSYQLNDVVTQLASGAHFSQVIAQQGGQIFQLWGRNLFDLIPMLPRFAAGIAGITIAIQALNTTMREMAAQREFGALLRTMGDGANYSATELAGLQRQIMRLGVSWADAGQMIRSGLGAGIGQGSILQLADIARNFAVPRGEEPAKVFADLAKAMHDGLPAVIAWNAELGKGVLRLEDLTELREIGRTQGGPAALARALEILSQRTRGAADDSGLFTKETKALSNAWDDLLHTLAQGGAVKTAIEAIKALIEQTAELVKVLDSLAKFIDSSPGIKWLAENGPSWANTAREFRNIKDFFTGPAPDPNKTGWQDAARAQQAGGMGQAAFINKLKTDTEELRQATQALEESTRKAGLPAGYRVEVISTERPGATVAGTGTPSQHGAGKAVDVRIVDDQGRSIPGSMGLSPRGADTTGLYAKLDTAFEAEMRQRFPGQPYAIGSRFQREPDPGHYSVGQGSEQAAQGAREGRPTGPTPPAGGTAAQLDASREALRLDNLRYDKQYDYNEQKAREAIYQDAINQADQQHLTNQDRLDFINRRVFEAQQERAEKIRKFDQDITNQRITDGKNSATIDAAGLAAREKAVANARGMLTLEQAQTAEMQGREEARKLFSNAEAAKKTERRLNDQINAEARGAELKDVTSLEGRLEAVRTKYQQIRQEIQKQREDFTGKGLPLNINEDRLARAERADTANETAKFYLDRLNSLTQQRQDVISATQASVGAGGMTISEAEEANKRSSEAITPAINEATKALEDFIRTSKDLDPTKADQYTAKLKQLRAEAQYVSPLFKTIRDTFEQSFSTGISKAFDTISEAVGGLIAKTKTWGDVMRAARTAAANFFAQLLRDIAMAILRYEALKLASSIFGIKDLGGSGGGLFSALFGSSASAAGTAGASATAAAPAVVLHDGGVVGRAGRIASAPAYWFAGAPRYHNGTMVGLAPNEQAAILQRGEEVLAADNPRNALNGGGRPGEIAIRNVLVDDPRRIPEAMSGSHGERVIVQTLVRNAATIRELVK